MKKLNQTMMMLLLLAGLTACDQQKSDFRNERESVVYQRAMESYHAGRIDDAIKGFRKVCHDEPDNSSARFQLACLLQDSKKDYLGAYCAYAEYLVQQPGSDKARLAKDRMLLCEKELAAALAEKHGLISNKAFAQEAEAARKAQALAEKRCAKLEEDLAQAMRRIAALGKESDRLKDVLRNDANDEEAESTRPVGASEIKTAKSLLDNEESAVTDRVKLSADVDRLRLEERTENALSSPLLPIQPKDAKAKRAAAEAAAEQKAEAERKAREAEKAARPEVYVVQEGDTLYKIAVRFYGRTSAWRTIRNANKAVISVDGRVKKGDRLRLP